MARYIDADKIDYSMASVYWETDKDGNDIYRRSAIAFESDIDEIPTADVVEVAKIKEAKAEIINRMNEFIAEWLNISIDTVNYWGGKVESMDIAKRLVNSVLTDLMDGTPQKEG